MVNIFQKVNCILILKQKLNMETYNFYSSAWILTEHVKNMVGFISGFVINSLKKCITCSACKLLLESNHVISTTVKKAIWKFS